MRIDEAIDYLSEGYCDVKPTDNEDMIKIKHKHNDAYEIALEALEKQIPKKWQYEMVNDDDTYVCPCCKEYWYMDYGNPATNKYNYCPNCGQRLDWEGEQE